MFSVIFEVWPRRERFDEYLELAKQLRPILESIDGFIDNERFESRSRAGWILSHSTWRDEKALVRWRTVAEHHAVQQRGREEVLADYHLRVGDVIDDSDGPVQEQRFDTTEVGAGKVVTLTELAPRAEADGVSDAADAPSLVGLAPDRSGLVDHDAFASIYNPGKLAVLLSWSAAAQAAGWQPSAPAGYTLLRHRSVRIVRDYAMFDRREAPQYHPDAAGRATLHAHGAA